MTNNGFLLFFFMFSNHNYAKITQQIFKNKSIIQFYLTLFNKMCIKKIVVIV